MSDKDLPESGAGCSAILKNLENRPAVAGLSVCQKRPLLRHFLTRWASRDERLSHRIVFDIIAMLQCAAAFIKVIAIPAILRLAVCISFAHDVFLLENGHEKSASPFSKKNELTLDWSINYVYKKTTRVVSLRYSGGKFVISTLAAMPKSIDFTDFFLTCHQASFSSSGFVIKHLPKPLLSNFSTKFKR